MTDPAVDAQIAEIDELIAAAKGALEAGGAVELTDLERRAVRLHETIARNPEATGNVNTKQLGARLAAILDGLNDLEQVIDARQAAIEAGGTNGIE